MNPIMIFHMTLDRGAISRLEAPAGSAVIIPFTGYVESALFSGRVLPGAADVQVVNAAGVRHMCASYMFEGTDSAGQPCRLFVRNNGWFEKGSVPQPFDAAPTFLTDSPTLAPYLHATRFRAEGHGTEEGVDIHIFDVLQDDGSGRRESHPLPGSAPRASSGDAKTQYLAASALCMQRSEMDADILQEELSVSRAEAKQLLQQLWQNGVIASDGTVLL